MLFPLVELMTELGTQFAISYVPEFASVFLVLPCIRIVDNATVMDRLDPKLVRISDNRGRNQDRANWARAIKAYYTIF
jgi:hypothetical protein